MVTDSVVDRFLAQAKIREIVAVLALLVLRPFDRAASHRLSDLRVPIETVGLAPQQCITQLLAGDALQEAI